MKKLLSTLCILATLAGTAQAAPYVLPSPQPGALTEYDLQPVYTLEGLYSFAAKSDYPDMYGARLGLNLYSEATGDFLHQFNLNVSGLWGDKTFDGYKVDMFMLPVTLGYNLNVELFDKGYLYLGGKLGWAYGEAKSDGYKESEGAFTWALGLGLKYHASESIYLHGGYEFSRTYFKRDTIGIFGQHTILLGVGTTF